MRFDLSEVEYSRPDLKSGLVIPRENSLELAEFLGIMVGDGHVGHYGYDRQMSITGNIRDREYYENYVNNLIYNIFNIKFNVYFQKSRSAINLTKQSKAIFYFLTKVIKLPSQRKTNITIPDCILNGSQEIKAAFLRGLADADFCLTIKHKPNKYPVIHGTSKSKELIQQCSQILQELGIKNNTGTEFNRSKERNKIYISNRVYVNGFDRVSKFMDLIGFKASCKLKKYEEVICAST